MFLVSVSGTCEAAGQAACTPWRQQVCLRLFHFRHACTLVTAMVCKQPHTSTSWCVHTRAAYILFVVCTFHTDYEVQHSLPQPKKQQKVLTNVPSDQVFVSVSFTGKYTPVGTFSGPTASPISQ